MRTFFYVIFKKFSFRFEQNALFKRDKSEREKDLCSYLMVGEEVNSMELCPSWTRTAGGASSHHLRIVLGSRPVSR